VRIQRTVEAGAIGCSEALLQRYGIALTVCAELTGEWRRPATV
jgi:hypothetical protein